MVRNISQLETENKILARYESLQRQRMRILLRDMTSRQRDFLDFIPLLFHYNDPKLPAYIEGCPFGIPNYSVANSTISIAKRLAPEYTYKRSAHLSFPLEGLYLMGSLGTIAQTFSSDLDFWLCHDPALSKDQLDLLQQKINKIEKLADRLGLEVHFFLMSSNSFSEDNKLELSDESSGSTQHFLLLEEFYRSGVLVAGRAPVWFLVPADKEDEYDQYVQGLAKKGLDLKQFIDFGSLNRISPAEFIGSAIWQLYKGLNSPYKAILKILLMEAYAAEYPKVQWISLIAKKDLHDDNRKVEVADAYIMMYEKIEQYLQSRLDEERLDLARQCFYLKVDRPLSTSDKSSNWRTRALSKIVKQWGWSDNKILDLDQHKTWKLERVNEIREEVVRGLRSSYENLDSFTKDNETTNKINPKELHILGVKLTVALKQRKHKISRVNLGISDDLSEETVKITGKRLRKGQLWDMSRFQHGKEPVSVKQSNSLVELLAWAHCNGVLIKSSQIIFQKGDLPITKDEFNRLLKYIRNHLPDNLVNKAPYEDLHQPRKAALSIAFINVAIDALEEVPGRATLLDKVRRIDYLTINTWNEVEVFSYASSKALFGFFDQYLHYHLPEEKVKTNLVVVGFGSHIAKKIAARFSIVCQEVKQNFLHDESDQEEIACDKRVVITVGLGYGIYQRKGKRIKHSYHEKVGDLINQLREKLECYTLTRFEKKSLSSNVIAVAFSMNKPGVVQCFFQKKQHALTTYIIDENGALLYQTQKKENTDTLIEKQKHFYLSYTQQYDKAAIEFYTLNLSEDQEWGVFSDSETDGILDKEAQVWLQSISPDRRDFIIRIQKKMFSSRKFSKGVYKAIAEHIIKSNGNSFSIERLGGQDKRLLSEISTYDLISLKHNIEKQVNRIIDK